MAEYIEREAFIAEQRHLYCDNCARRKGMKNGKMKFVYAIGDAPCRACDIGDMLDSVEDFHAADVATVRHGRWVWDEESWWHKCSACGMTFGYDGTYELFDHGFQLANYCPNCGAKMDIPAEEGE